VVARTTPPSCSGAEGHLLHRSSSRLVDRGLIDTTHRLPILPGVPAQMANRTSLCPGDPTEPGLSALHRCQPDDLLNTSDGTERQAHALLLLVRQTAFHPVDLRWLVSGLPFRHRRGRLDLAVRSGRSRLVLTGLHLGRPPADSLDPARADLQCRKRPSTSRVQRGSPKIAALRYPADFAPCIPRHESCCAGDLPFDGRGNSGGQLRCDGARAGLDVRCDLQKTAAKSRHPFRPSSCGGPSVAGQPAAGSSLAGARLHFTLVMHRVPGDSIPCSAVRLCASSLGGPIRYSGLAFGFVHQPLLAPFVVVDHAGFAVTGGVLAACRRPSTRKHGFERVTLGLAIPRPGAVCGLTGPASRTSVGSRLSSVT